MPAVGRPIVGIIDYEAGNIRSIENALEHLGAEVLRVQRESDIGDATHLLLPGVGAFGHCALELKRTGMLPRLKKAALEEHVPILGICVGMQLLADRSEELGDHSGLGWAGGVVRVLHPQPPRVRVPHVGWNEVRFDEPFGSFAAGDSADFYFDHSFAFYEPVHAHVIGTCHHGGDFAAVVRHDNLVAAQFHPEKSQQAGLRFLSAFLALERPC